MSEQVKLDRQIKSTTSKLELFKTAPNRRRALVGFLLMWNNQFTGVLIIANYGIIIYIALGMTGYMPLLLTSLWVTSTFPGNIVGLLIFHSSLNRSLTTSSSAPFISRE